MTKMGTMLRYGKKNLQISSYSEPNGRYDWNLYTAFGTEVQMMTIGWPLTFLYKGHLTFLYKGQLWFLVFLYGKMLKWCMFSETIEVLDTKLI